MKKNHLRLRNRMLLVYLAGGLLPMMLILILLLAGQTKAILTLSQNKIQTELVYLKNNLNEKCRILSDVSKRMYFDTALEHIAFEQYTDYALQVQDFRSYTTLSQYEDSYTGDLHSVTVYLNNPTLLGNSQLAYADSGIRQTRWYGQALRDGGQARWWLIEDPADGHTYLTLVRLLRSQNGRKVGVAVLRMNLDALQAQFSQHGSNLYLMLEDQIVLTNDPAPDEAALAQIVSNPVFGSWRERFHDETVRLTVQTLDNTGSLNCLTFLCVEPYRELLASTFQGLRQTFLLILLSVGCSVGMILCFSIPFSRRVECFQGEMEKAARGERALAPTLGGDDEISELYQHLNTMIADIDALTARVFQSRLEQEQLRSRQHEAEFKMLASQINPHFLYNTLESIRMKAYASGDREVADMVKILARLMRRNIEVRDTLVPLREEMAATEAYLKLQNYRFGDRLCYELQVGAETQELFLLPLLIQPLVENAFVHGVRSRMENSRIAVRSWVENDRLCISVEDNGVGISPDQLATLRAGLEDAGSLSDTHIGLANVHQRIRLYYGAPYGLRLDSTPGRGTTAALILPRKAEQEKELYPYE